MSTKKKVIIVFGLLIIIFLAINAYKENLQKNEDPNTRYSKNSGAEVMGLPVTIE